MVAVALGIDSGRMPVVAWGVPVHAAACQKTSKKLEKERPRFFPPQIKSHHCLEVRLSTAMYRNMKANSRTTSPPLHADGRPSTILFACLIVLVGITRALPAAPPPPPVVAEIRDGVEFGWGPLTVRSAAFGNEHMPLLPSSTPVPDESDDVQYGGSYGGSYGDDGYGYGDSYGYGEYGYGYGSGDLEYGAATIVRPSTLHTTTTAASAKKSTNIGALFRKNTIASNLFSSESAKASAAERASSTMDEVNAIMYSRRAELQPMNAHSKR